MVHMQEEDVLDHVELSPPLIMPVEVAAKALDIVEEVIAETDKELGS